MVVHCDTALALVETCEGVGSSNASAVQIRTEQVRIKGPFVNAGIMDRSIVSKSNSTVSNLSAA